MTKHPLSLLTILLFLLMAIGSADEGSDPTDTETERLCLTLDPPIIRPFEFYINVTDKVSGIPIEGASVNIDVTLFKFEAENGQDCYGKLKVKSSENFNHVTDNSGIISFGVTWKFEDANELCIVKVECHALDLYGQKLVKERLIYYNTIGTVYFNFSFLSNENL